MPPVEPHRKASQEPTHNRGDRNAPCAQKQMHVVGHERPRKAGRSRLLKESRQPFKKILPVLVILENSSSFYPSDDNMVQGTGGVNASSPWHAFQGSLWHPLVNKETMFPSFPLFKVLPGDDLPLEVHVIDHVVEEIHPK
jgi:hypothetical protein